MGNINYMKVLLGGLLAGVVLNIGEGVLNVVILAEENAELMAEMGIVETPMMITFYVIWSFLLGIVMVWIYAAIRPRFGAGVQTGIIAGCITWTLLWFLGFGSLAIFGYFPVNLVIITLIWGFFEAPLAAVAGAWVYKEGNGVADAPKAEVPGAE